MAFLAWALLSQAAPCEPTHRLALPAALAAVDA